MTLGTPRGREIAGTQLVALALIKAFLPHVFAGGPWTGRLAAPQGDQVLQRAQARLNTDGRQREVVFAALARQGAAGLALALGEESPEEMYRWLDVRAEALGEHDRHASELAAARMVRAVAAEIIGGADADDVPPGVAAAAVAGVDGGEVLVSLVLFAATMFRHVFQSVEQAVAAVDAQAAPLRQLAN